MNICFCTHRLPYPPVAGGKRETFKLVECLGSEGHTVDLVTYADDQDRVASMEDAVDCTVHAVPGLPDRTPTNLLRNVVSRDPLPVMKADTTQYRGTARRQAEDADVTHLHALQTSFLAADDAVPTPTVVRFNNVKYEIYRQFARFTDNPAKAAYAYLQWYKSRGYERAVPAESELTLAITQEDRKRLNPSEHDARIDVLPAGVDPSEFDLLAHDTESTVVTFFGSMDYHPNEDAVLWFVESILPSIRERRPDVTFEIVGKNPSRDVQDLDKRDAVHVTGFVDDIGEHVARAAVVVLPIRVGTGIRMKALHAMAMGKPLVSTPLGVQGIDAVDGEHLLLAEESGAFAQAVLDLLADGAQQNSYRQSARELVERDHDWTIIADRLEEFYQGVVADV